MTASVSLSQFNRFGPEVGPQTGPLVITFPILTGTGFTPNNTVSVVSRWHAGQDPDRVVTETFPTDEAGSFQNRLARTLAEEWGLQEIKVDVTDVATGATVHGGPAVGNDAPRAPDYSPIAKVPVPSPGWLAVSPDGTRIYSSLGNGQIHSQVNGVSVIDAASYAITQIVIPTVRDNGSMFTLNADGSRLYVSTPFSLTVVDTATHQQTVLTMENDPTYSSLGPDGTRLYVCTDDEGLFRVEVLDIDPNSATYHTLVGSFDYSEGSNGAGGIAVTDRYIYLASNDLTYIGIDKDNVGGWGNPNGDNRGVVVAPVPNSPGQHRVYLGVSASVNQVAIFDEVADASGYFRPQMQQILTLTGSSSGMPFTMVASTASDAERVYAVGVSGNTVAVIDTETTKITWQRDPFTGRLKKIVTTRPVGVAGSFPISANSLFAAVSPDGYTLYVTGFVTPDEGFLQEIALVSP